MSCACQWRHGPALASGGGDSCESASCLQPGSTPHPRPARHLLQPATPTAELARKFQCLKLDAKMYMLRLLLVGLAVAGALLVADVLSRALLGHGLAHYLLPPVLTPSYPSDPEWSLPPWAPLAIPFLHLAGMAARKAREACRARRLFWAAAAARRQANAARLNTKRTGAQQPSTQP